MPEADSAVIFMAWGERYVEEVHHAVRESKLSAYPIYLITDRDTPIKDSSEFEVIRADFRTTGFGRKTELLSFVPSGYQSYVVLDSDVRVLEDIEFGFQQARIHGLAMSPAPAYSLDHFLNFHEVMIKEGVKPADQMLYNAGVIFFSPTEAVIELFALWHELYLTHQAEHPHDQSMLAMAMEKMGFNPYTLTYNYNYRGFGDPISGVVRIWHSHYPVPERVNVFEAAWPRRVVMGSRITVLRDPLAPTMGARISKLVRRGKARLARMLGR